MSSIRSASTPDSPCNLERSPWTCSCRQARSHFRLARSSRAAVCRSASLPVPLRDLFASMVGPIDVAAPCFPQRHLDGGRHRSIAARRAGGSPRGQGGGEVQGRSLAVASDEASEPQLRRLATAVHIGGEKPNTLGWRVHVITRPFLRPHSSCSGNGPVRSRANLGTKHGRLNASRHRDKSADRQRTFAVKVRRI